MNQDFPEGDVQFERRGRVGVVTLNRPKKLNSTTLSMTLRVHEILDACEIDPAVETIFIHGAGDRAFCAGGDIRAFHSAGMDHRSGATTQNDAVIFFIHEYMMTRRLFHYPKPIVAFMNGITMGGGYGIAGNCKYRVVTDKTVFAMPEVGIGFFPDVGSIYHLLKSKLHVGHYLALMGVSVNAADTFYAGLGDYYIPVSQQAELIAQLEKENVEDVLRAMSEAVPGKGSLAVQAGVIDKIFALGDVEKVIEALREEKSPWAQETLKILLSRSPTSVKIVAEYLRRARGMAFDAVIETDFTLVQHFMHGHDLYEGIRATLIDRDKNPRWSPADMVSVSPEIVANYFKPGPQSLAEAYGK